jgi:uncharacterized protein YndB with AHSA1/START domain
MEENMKHDFPATQSITIGAPVDRVWNALTNPDMIRQYLFGTEAVSDWKEGSPIIYRGEWQGKAYEDKGMVVKVVPETYLETTYWSGLEGHPDLPENYKRVIYKLVTEKSGTRVTVTQENNASKEEKSHSEQNWKMVLEGMKRILETR